MISTRPYRWGAAMNVAREQQPDTDVGRQLGQWDTRSVYSVTQGLANLDADMRRSQATGLPAWVCPSVAANSSIVSTGPGGTSPISAHDMDFRESPGLTEYIKEALFVSNPAQGLTESPGLTQYVKEALLVEDPAREEPAPRSPSPTPPPPSPGGRLTAPLRQAREKMSRSLALPGGPAFKLDPEALPWHPPGTGPRAHPVPTAQAERLPSGTAQTPAAASQHSHPKQQQHRQEETSSLPPIEEEANEYLLGPSPQPTSTMVLQHDVATLLRAQKGQLEISENHQKLLLHRIAANLRSAMKVDTVMGRASANVSDIRV